MAEAKKLLGRPPTMEAPRQTIVKHAAVLFAEQGFDKTSLNDIAGAVGVSKAAVYHYFPSKQAIYEEIIVGLLDGLHAFVKDEIGDEGPAEERLARFMRGHAIYFERNYTAFATLLHGVAGVGKKSRGEIEARDRFEAMLRQILVEGAASGSFEVTDVAIAAKGILSIINWMVRWFSPSGPRSAVDVANTYFAMIYKGIRRGD